MRKENRLRQEMRLIGLSTQDVADKFDVSIQTVNNWISGRIFIPPVVSVMLQEMGIPKNAVRNPAEKV